MKHRFLTVGLLLTVSLVIAVFNSCSKNNEDKIAVTSISLDEVTLTLAIGEDYTLIATITPTIDPAMVDGRTVTWKSSDETKATVVDGKVTAIAQGDVTITAKAGNKTATCIVTVVDGSLFFDEGVIINGVKWATRNVDAPGTFASSIEAAGMFYQWGRNIGWSATNPMTSSPSGAKWNGWGTPAEEVWKKVNDPSPSGWRVPTKEEIQSLLNYKVKNEWTTENGVKGRRFTDRDTGNTIFLPAVGYREFSLGGFNYSEGLFGGYWSNLQHGGNAYSLIFQDFPTRQATITMGTGDMGLSIRCVAE